MPKENPLRKWSACGPPRGTMRKKIAAAARAEIEAAERAARLELKALAANLAVDGAESLIAKQLTTQAQELLISNFDEKSGREAELKSASLQYANAMADIALAQAPPSRLPAAPRIWRGVRGIRELRTFLASPAVAWKRNTPSLKKSWRAWAPARLSAIFFLCWPITGGRT